MRSTEGEGRGYKIVGVLVAESAEAAHNAMAAILEDRLELYIDKINVTTDESEPGNVCARCKWNSDMLDLLFRRGNILVLVGDEALARALDEQILAAIQERR